jgi:hypothetical protein
MSQPTVKSEADTVRDERTDSYPTQSNPSEATPAWGSAARLRLDHSNQELTEIPLMRPYPVRTRSGSRSVLLATSSEAHVPGVKLEGQQATAKPSSRKIVNSVKSELNDLGGKAGLLRHVSGSPRIVR